jgi:predicted lipase
MEPLCVSLCAEIAQRSYRNPYNSPTAIFADILNIPPIDSVKYFESANDAEVYMIRFPNHIVFACRGTESTQDVRIDLMFRKTGIVGMDPTIKVHRGFARQFSSIRDFIQTQIMQQIITQKPAIVFVGHSLGGALATIGSAVIKTIYPELECQCITFGSPRVGNKAFADLFNSSIIHSQRFVNGNDIIAKIPRIRYQHVGNEINIGNMVRYGCFRRYLGSVKDHSMKRYVKAVKKYKSSKSV